MRSARSKLGLGYERRAMLNMLVCGGGQEAVPGVRLTCRQVSPVIPHDYKDASLPVSARQVGMNRDWRRAS